MSYDGVIPIMEMLAHEQNSKADDFSTTEKVLDLVNQIISHENGQVFLESLCFVGVIPAVAKLQKSESPEIRVSAAHLIKRFCKLDPSNTFVRKTFVASDGVKILVSMIDREYNDQDKGTMGIVLDCICDIFENPPTLQDNYDGDRKRASHHPRKGDFCRLFTKAQLLRPLVVLLWNLVKDAEFDKENQYSDRIGWLLRIIAQQNDPVVKKAFVAKNVLPAILRILSLLDTAQTPSQQLLLDLLKVIRCLTVPDTIEELISMNSVSGVCPFLVSENANIQQTVIMCILHMVKLRRKCREEAASNGVIPILMALSEDKDKKAVQSFVIQILCKMPENASTITLYEMKKHNGIEFFLDLVQNTKKAYIQVDALQALANWLRQDTPRVELQLIQPHHVTKLITVFENPRNREILSSIHEMVKISGRLADKLGKSEVFLKALEKWLDTTSTASTSDRTHILLTLLQFTSNLFEQLTDRSKVRFVQILYKQTRRIAENYNKALVKVRAKKIMELFESSVDIRKLGLHE